MDTRIPIPLSLRYLIDANEDLLNQYRTQLQQKVLKANEEVMKMLRLDPEDGWQLDLDTYEYVKVTSNELDDALNP